MSDVKILPSMAVSRKEEAAVAPGVLRKEEAAVQVKDEGSPSVQVKLQGNRVFSLTYVSKIQSSVYRVTHYYSDSIQSHRRCGLHIAWI